MEGADGWQLSNHPILLSAVHLASLEIIHEAGMSNLRKKSMQLTGYLEFLLDEIDTAGQHYRLLTPRNPAERGCQLSLYMLNSGKDIFNELGKAGIIADWREPNVIRLAPVPLYNTFEDVYRFSEVFRKAVNK